MSIRGRLDRLGRALSGTVAKKAQARIDALRAESEGLRERMYRALKDGEGDEYLRLRAREHAILRDLTGAEAGALDLRRQSLQERYAALADAEPGLQAEYEDTVRRNQEKIRTLNLESQVAASAYYAAVREARVIEQELREMGVVL